MAYSARDASGPPGTSERPPLDDIPALSLDPEQAQAARQGRVISGMPHADGLYFAKSGSVPVALVEIESGTMKIVRGFNFPDVAE